MSSRQAQQAWTWSCNHQIGLCWPGQEQYSGGATEDVGDGKGIVCILEHMLRALIGEWAGDGGNNDVGNVPCCAPIVPLLEAVYTSSSVSLQEGRNMNFIAAVKSDRSHPRWLKETRKISRKMGKFLTMISNGGVPPYGHGGRGASGGNRTISP